MSRVVAPKTVEQMDDMAERMANGCRSVSAVARDMGLTQSRADQLWQRIRRGLGEQAK